MVAVAARASQAIEELVAARAWGSRLASRGLGLASARQIAERTGREVGDVIQGSRDDGQVLSELGQKADAFWWASPILDVVEAAAPELPNWTLRRELLPTPSGFFWLSRGIALKSGVVLRAFGYVTGRDRVGDEGAMISFFSDIPAWTTTTPGGWPLSWGPQFRHVRPFGGVVVRNDFPTMPHSAPITSDDIALCNEGWALLGAMLLFLEQRVAVSSPEPLDRPARRRLEKADVEYPVLRVIRLRTTENRARAEDDVQPVDWRYRWLVRGHWRQQWHPSDGSHRPLWITPYVKGPDDKPLKTPAASVFAVVR